MKIINIQSCGVCPYCKEFPSLDGLRCIKKGRRVVIDSELPDWCPLEDTPAWISVLKRVFTYGNATDTHLAILDYLFENGIPKSEYETWGRK